MKPAGGAHQMLKTLKDLTPEEARSDLYITAIHELNRRRRTWSSHRLNRVARDLGLDAKLLRLTWCLLHATERSRQRAPPVRLATEKSYLRVLQGKSSDPVPAERANLKVSSESFREATEALLAAGNGAYNDRRRVAAMLRGRMVEMQMREDAGYEDDVSLSSDEADATLSGIAARAVKELPGAANLDPEELSDMVAKLTGLAEGVMSDGETAVSEDVLRKARYRMEVLRWMTFTDNSSKTKKRRRAMEKAVDAIAQESRVRLHPVTKRALGDAFVDESSLAEGGLHAFRALVPGRVVAVVRKRELDRLLQAMKTPDTGIAERLVDRFGSARRCLRAGKEDVRKIFAEDWRGVMEFVHGYDEDLHEVLKEVPGVWLLARVVREMFGGLSSARRKRFQDFMEGRAVVELSRDERLLVYRAVHVDSTGSDREEYERSWGLFETVAMHTKVEDCLAATMGLLEWDSAIDTNGSDGTDLISVCLKFGFDLDEVARLEMYLIAKGFCLVNHVANRAVTSTQ